MTLFVQLLCHQQMVLSVVQKLQIHGRAISVPVGDVTLGRVFNVLGEVIDLGEEIPASERRDPIHR